MLLRLFCCVCALAISARAQIGDKPGEAQKPLVPRKLIPPAPALAPAEALKSFKLAPGFRIELVAAEPLVQDPVAMTFGPDGRLWVVEMRGYMPDLDGSTEDAPVGRVVVLRDTDGDGRMDQSQVFLDGLILPRAIALVRDGVLIGAPPKLLFCRDTNGDGKADKTIEVATDYGVQVDPKRPALANPERAPNGLLWALDNWIYSAAYTARFRFQDGQWERGATTFRGQWGLSQDDWGHLFYNSNSDQLRADIIPAHYLNRNPNDAKPGGANVKIATSQSVWPARVNPGVNRAYRPEILREGRLKEFTAACAPWIYRGDLFPPEFYGNAFVCEPAGNLIKRNRLTATNGTLAASEAYHQKEFLASTDERFRPVNLCTGPDGALYVVDLYRGVLQHRISLTTYLRKQSEDRGLDQPIHLGRLWRIVPEGKPARRVKPDFAGESPAQWVAHLSHGNAWWRETAQRLLVEKGDVSVVPALQQLVTAGAAPPGRLHALWTLEGLRQLDLRTVAAASRDPDARVRAAAVRVSEVFFNSEDKADILATLLKLTTDASAEVQLQLALTLGQAREGRADEALAGLVKSAVGNVFLRDAALTGLYGRELELLERLIVDPAWSRSDTNADLFLGGLARCVFSERRPERVQRLFSLIAAQPAGASKRQLALLNGIALTAPTMEKKPVKFQAEPAAWAALQKISNATLHKRVVKIDQLITWPGKPGAKPEPVVTPLTPAQQARFAAGKELFLLTCAACHQPHGLGMDGLAPPLVDSEWVLGSEQRLVRIVLHGLTGPIKVKGGSINLDMPGLGMFDDEQLAAVLTYVRREWEHTATPVEPATVARVRGENANREQAWSEAELLKIK